MRVILTPNVLSKAGIFSSLAVIFLGFAAFLPQRAEAGIAIEQAQRKFQGRMYFFGGYAGCVQWPSVDCIGPAPFFPPDKYYGDLDTDTTQAVELVQDLADKFYGLGIYSGFYNTSDGSANIEDKTSFSGADNYQLSDFPTSGSFGGGSFDLASVTTNNYTNCLAVLQSYIEQLQFVPTYLSEMAVTTNSDTNDIHFGERIDHKNGSGSSNSCSTAFGLAQSSWASDPGHYVSFWWGIGVS